VCFSLLHCDADARRRAAWAVIEFYVEVKTDAIGLGSCSGLRLRIGGFGMYGWRAGCVRPADATDADGGSEV
jgi:hypothetical protein